MHGSRASLEKWAAAIQLLSASGGVNASQLSAAIGVTYKTAWSMLRSIRRAIGAVEAERPLRGEVCAGVAFAGRWFYQPYVLYPDERVVIVGAAVDRESGMPLALKMHVVPREHLTEFKEITRQGKAAFESRHVHPLADRFTFLKPVQMHRFNPLAERFQYARQWLNARFRGLGAASIQPYLDEYCFRFGIAARGASPVEEWLKLCLRHDLPRSARSGASGDERRHAA